MKIFNSDRKQTNIPEPVNLRCTGELNLWGSGELPLMTSDLVCNTSGRKSLLSLCPETRTWSPEKGEHMEWRPGQSDCGFRTRS